MGNEFSILILLLYYKKERNNMIYIGNHLSSSKGFEAMGKAALKLGANTFAFFTRNPRGGKAKEIKNIFQYVVNARTYILVFQEAE